MAETGGQGFQPPFTFGSQWNAVQFLVQALMTGTATAQIVQVKAVTSAGDVAGTGTVTILPLVNQIDEAGNPTPHQPINNVPYARLAAGANAVILDPQIGDIGIAVFSMRDISAVKATKAQANPGSYRTHDMSDAMYIPALLTGVPTQYVRFFASGIEVVSPTKVLVQAPQIECKGATTVTGNLHVTGTTTGDGAGSFQGTQVHTHTHSGVQPGTGNSGPPN